VSNPNLRRSVSTGHLPVRYSEDWRAPFDARLQPALIAGCEILDVGAGRRPTVPVSRRPPGCVYVGLDLAAAELDKAPPGSYDETHVADLALRVPLLQDRFDLVVSWEVFEHVKALDVAVENLRSYLRPGGRLVAHMSGRFSLFATVNRLLPYSVGAWAMCHLLKRARETVFPAYYDHGWHQALQRMLAPWSEFEVLPQYRGAGYLSFCPVLQSLYLVYENWACRRGRSDLATHYLVTAVR